MKESGASFVLVHLCALGLKGSFGVEGCGVCRV